MRILQISSSPFHEIRYLTSGRKGEPRRCVLPFFKATVDSLPQADSSIVLTSDLQGRERGGTNRLLGEVVAEELWVLQEMKEIPVISAVILAGDLYDYPDLRKMGGTGDTTSVWNAFASPFPKAIGVLGNHDQVAPDRLDPEVSILDGTSFNLDDLKIFGVSGIIGQTHKNQRKTPEEFTRLLHRGLTQQANIIVLHQGPDLPAQDRSGEPMIREILERSGESLIVFGHCHWPEPLAQIGRNQVVNVDARVLVLINPETKT